MIRRESRFLTGRICPKAMVLLVVVGSALAVTAGCAREMLIHQEDYVNTAMHADRQLAARTGEPLEVTIVSIYPKDLAVDANDRLNPDRGITSDVWYRDRPQPGDKVDMEEPHGRFRLPKDQVFVRTEDSQYYGTKAGGRLRGALIDKQTTVKTTFKFAGPLHSNKSVIYVFPKFIDNRGEVLPVPPAKFHPPGAYTHELSVKIGVNESRGNYGQYIENTTERKLHGGDG
ncbi:MAG TPA: hypothetical protein VM243_18920 [Phycisphaerae bacterium]|nr:hypothetical protein [Phycisphaerae bacterium]